MYRPSSKKEKTDGMSLSRIERFEEDNKMNATTSGNVTQSSVSFVRRIIPQQEVDVYTVKTETTTKVQRIRKKKKSCKLRMAGEASFGSFMIGPQYQHLETPKQQLRGVTWLTTEIASLFPRTQKAVETALGELLIYALFVIVILIVILNLNVYGKYHYGQYLRRNLIGRPQNYRLGISSSEEIKNFDEIFTQKQMFRFLNDTFIFSDFMDYFYKRAYEKRTLHIRDFNYIIGGIQLRQFRMPNDSCTVPEIFKKVLHMNKCYGEYTESKSDKRMIKPRYDALTATTFAAFRIDPFEYTEPDNEYNNPVHGIRSNYPGSGGFCTNYISAIEPSTVGANLTAEDHNTYLNAILHASGWIRRESRAVIIEILNYNPSIRMMGQAKIIFEYLPEGGILPSLQLNVIRVYHLKTSKDYFMMGLMIAMCAFLIIFIIQEIREIAFFGWKYIIKFWSWVDIAIVVSGIVAQVNLFHGMSELKYRTDEYFGAPSYFPGAVFRLDNVVRSELVFDESMCWLLFFTCLKIIRYSIYFGNNDRFSRTLGQGASTLIAFAFRYGTAFIAFAQFGYFLFGTYHESYSTFYSSCLAIIRFNFGYIDFDELINIRGKLGLIYVLLLLFYMVGYMMALLLAILFNFYTINESEVVIKRGPTAGGMCCSWCTRLKHYFSRRKKKVLPVDNITTDELLDSLDILNFTDPEIDLFQIKYKLNEKKTSDPEYVSKILWNVIEEIQTDVKRNADDELRGVELEDRNKNENRKPLYTKQYNALVKQMKNLEIQAEILFEKTTRTLATARIGKCMLQPRQVIKEACPDCPLKLDK